MVVKILPDAGLVFVKHSNGTIKEFKVSAATKIIGKGKAADAKALFKGQTVDVLSIKDAATEFVVVEPPDGPTAEKADGPPVVGVVDKVKADKFGDKGTLAVTLENGTKVEFQVHNATNIDYLEGQRTEIHTLQGVKAGQRVSILHAGKDAVQIDVVMSQGQTQQNATFHGMVVKVLTDSKQVFVKHANGTIKDFKLTDATKIVGKGQAANTQVLLKGQVVDVLSSQGKALTFDVLQPPDGPTLEKATGPAFVGVVDHVKRDQFGDNGSLTVTASDGTKKEFLVHNATNIDYKEGKRTDIHTLQGVTAGQTVSILSTGNDAVQIDVIAPAKK